MRSHCEGPGLQCQAGLTGAGIVTWIHAHRRNRVESLLHERAGAAIQRLPALFQNLVNNRRRFAPGPVAASVRLVWPSPFFSLSSSSQVAHLRLTCGGAELRPVRRPDFPITWAAARSASRSSGSSTAPICSFSKAGAAMGMPLRLTRAENWNSCNAPRVLARLVGRLERCKPLVNRSFGRFPFDPMNRQSKHDLLLGTNKQGTNLHASRHPRSR